MRERKLFKCMGCGEETDAIRVVILRELNLELCPSCHDWVQEGYSELEVIR